MKSSTIYISRVLGRVIFEPTQRKNITVMRQSGCVDCLTVNSAAVVFTSSLTFRERFRKNLI